MPNHYIGDLLDTIAMSGLSRVRTELLELTVVLALAPHPVQMHRQFARHGNLRDLSPTSQGEVKEPVSAGGCGAGHHPNSTRVAQPNAGPFLPSQCFDPYVSVPWAESKGYVVHR